MKKLIIIQTILPDYRKNFYQVLSDRLGNQFQLYAGDSSFETSIKPDHRIPHIRIKNHFLLNRKFLFQTGIFHLLFSNDKIVLELNPRIINHWIFLITRKIFRKKTILWGHAWPRKGKDSKSDKLRHLLRLMGDEIIVYTEQQKKELQEKMPGKKITAAPNALYRRSEMESVTENEVNHLIYVGRLTKKKKVFFLVQAFHQSLNEIPKNVKLFIVGEGEDKEKIKRYLQENHLENRINLLGPIFDYKKLKNLYAKSFFSVSPGYIGLSVTQSFGFGVPIIVSKNENHSPEIEAVKEGENAVFFETDNISSFVETLKTLYNQKQDWIAKRNRIADFCRNNYSVETMVETFLNL